MSKTLVLAASLIFAQSFALSCGTQSPEDSSAQAGSLVHLDEQLDRAQVVSAQAATAAHQQRTWRFDEPRNDWRVISSETFPGLAGVRLQPIEGATRLALIEPDHRASPMLVGGIATDVAEGPRNAWTGILVRARSHSRLAGIGAACNVDRKDAVPNGFAFFAAEAGTSPVFNDGSVQDYFLPLGASHVQGSAREMDVQTLRSIAVFVSAPQPAELEIITVTLVPRGASYLESVGGGTLTRDSITRHTLFAHAPAKLAWRLRVPDAGRLDVGLTCLEGESVAYRATVKSAAGEAKELLSETVKDAATWRQRSLDLSPWAGTEIELCLEASSPQTGAVALWGAPIVSGRARAPRPNVIFYVIDGGGADLMSVYGYNRRTTPYLERLAAEGVVFEHAHSNATWTQPSTASFMTSLHHSVLGGLRRGVHSTGVPRNAVTMAEHMRRGGYQTAVFTSNPNAARVIGLERGVDMMRDVETEHSSTSSTELHEWFWRFRRDYPGHPYWVHFQTTDVHEPNEPSAPYAGLFVPPEDRSHIQAWDEQLFEKAGDLFGTTSIADFYDQALEKAQIDRHAYYNGRRGLYDETMAHQDRELARLVERLKAEGEWQDTLLVIAADHGHPAGTFARFGRGLIEPRPESWQGALFDSYNTRVPLIFIWPGKIAGGRRIEQPVSMIDVLPTILELTGLPQPEILQGRSLAPLLLGGALEPRPVILDEFRVDEASGEMIGNIEMIDGRWGASLEIAPVAAGGNGSRGRHAVPAGGRWGAVHPFFASEPRLLLYDLWSDPFAARAVNDAHPELVERFTHALLEQWGVHRALAQRFSGAGDQALTPEMLKQLQALGYVK